MTSALAQQAIGITDLVGNIAIEAARTGNTAREVTNFLSGVKLIARFIPGLSSAVAVLDIAQPIIEKIAAGAPILHRVIEQGDALAATAQRVGLIDNVKQLYAIAVNADPARPETSLKAADVSDETAAGYLGSIFERSFFSPQDPRFNTPLAG